MLQRAAAQYRVLLTPYRRTCPSCKGDRELHLKYLSETRCINVAASPREEPFSIFGHVYGRCRKDMGGCGCSVRYYGHTTTEDRDHVHHRVDCDLVFSSTTTCVWKADLEVLTIRLVKQPGGVTFGSESTVFTLINSRIRQHLDSEGLKHDWLQCTWELYRAMAYAKQHVHVTENGKAVPCRDICVVYPLSGNMDVIKVPVIRHIESKGFPDRGHDCVESGVQHIAAHLATLRRKGVTISDAEILEAFRHTLVADACGKAAFQHCRKGSECKVRHNTYDNITYPGAFFEDRSDGQCVTGGKLSGGACASHQEAAVKEKKPEKAVIMPTEGRGMQQKLRRKAQDRKVKGWKARAESMRQEAGGTLAPVPDTFNKVAEHEDELHDDELHEQFQRQSKVRKVSGKEELGSEAAKFGEKKFIVRVCYNAGVMVLMRPCGIVVLVVPIFQHESLSQLYLMVDMLLSQNPGHPRPVIKFLVYDYGCGAQQFFDRHPQLFMHHNYAAFKCIVDRFHFGTHNDEYCRLHCDPNKCAGIDHVNTEACEQLFSWLGKYKFQTSGMTYSTYRFFIYQVVLLHNEFLLNGE